MRQFAPLFGRDAAQVRSEQYLRGLCVQHADRRNAENLAEAIAGASPRALQRFVTDSPWESTRVLTRLQRVVGTHLSAPDGVWVLDDSGFPKQGTHSVGVGHQYCGQVGKVTNCQTGVFLAYVSSRGHALVDARLYLPRAWIADPARCRAAGVPVETTYQTKPELGRQLLQAARERGQLAGQWVTADEAYGQIPSFRDALDDDGWWYVLEVPRTTPVFTTAAATAIPAGSPRGRRPTKPRLRRRGAAARVRWKPWRRRWPRRPGSGSRWRRAPKGPAPTSSPRSGSGRAVRGCPGRACWALWRRNLDGSELKPYLSNAPTDTPLAHLGAGRVVALAGRDRVRDPQAGGRPRRVRSARVARLASPDHHGLAGRRVPAVPGVMIVDVMLVVTQQAWQREQVGRPVVDLQGLGAHAHGHPGADQARGDRVGVAQHLDRAEAT